MLKIVGIIYLLLILVNLTFGSRNTNELPDHGQAKSPKSTIRKEREKVSKSASTFPMSRLFTTPPSTASIGMLKVTTRSIRLDSIRKRAIKIWTLSGVVWLNFGTI